MAMLCVCARARCLLLPYLGVSRAKCSTVLGGLPLPVHWRRTALGRGVKNCRWGLKRSVLRHGCCRSWCRVGIRRCSLSMVVLAVEQEAWEVGGVAIGQGCRHLEEERVVRWEVRHWRPLCCACNYLLLCLVSLEVKRTCWQQVEDRKAGCSFVLPMVDYIKLRRQRERWEDEGRGRGRERW
jgi:hypothetical protein